MRAIARQEAETFHQPERYRLDVVLSGRPVSTNRYQDRFTVYSKKAGKEILLAVHTTAAERWLSTCYRATLEVVAHRSPQTPHPRSWPRPLRFGVYVRDRRVDLDNCLKVMMDGVKHGLCVDDKEYEYGCIAREAGPVGVRLVIESAPIPLPRAPLYTTKPAPPRAGPVAIATQATKRKKVKR